MEDTRVAEDSRTALERIYREHGDRLWRSVLLFSGEPDVASDAVAEAFAQALRRGAELRSPDRWVWRTAFRIARGMLKERRRMSPDPPELAYEMPLGAVELMADLGRLSPMQRAVIVLHYYGDLPVRQTAALLGSTQAAVRVHLHRARRRLKALLEDRDD
jgi:RNA polymerase sigma factor (sigma-70 family)